MASYQLIAYIRSQIALNVPKAEIVAHLVSAGWQQAEIEQTFSEMGLGSGSTRGPAAFAGMTQSRPRKRHLGRSFAALVLCAVLAFAAFSIVFDAGIIGPRQQPADTVAEENVAQSPTQDELATPVPNPAVVPISNMNPSSSVNPSSGDKDQIIVAILTQKTILQSGNAATIRNYLEISASPQYAQQLMAMSDSAVLSLASSMLAGSGSITIGILSSPQTVWQFKDDSTVELTIATPNGPVTRTARKVSGVWY